MNIVETTAPISIEYLKKYFIDKNTLYIIDYKQSQLKSNKLMTYLSNLEIPCDIKLNELDTVELYELVKSYMETTMIVNLKSLELFVIHLILETKGLLKEECHKDFIEANKELIDSWISKLDSLTLYNMFSVDNDEFKSFVKQFPEDDTDSVHGINFVSLLENKEFYDIYIKIDQNKLKFYSKYFQEYMFRGKNMYSYWANENNSLFLLTYGISSGVINTEQYISSKKQDIQELSNATSV